MDELLTYYFWASPLMLWAIILGVMTLLWFVSTQIKNAGIVDVLWGFSFFFIVIFYFTENQGDTPRHWLLLVCVGLSSLRLGFYLLKRFCGEYPVEDARYTEFREHWKNEGKNAEWMMWLAYQLQGVLMVLLSLPIYLAMRNPSPVIGMIEWMGAALMMLAVLGEAIADDQLRRFKANPENRGQVCQSGLWYYSRHPNYFFQWLLWVGVAVYTLGSPLGWLGLYVPVLMLHFLINVTGIAATEARALASRGEAYRCYQKTTSPFVPWFKRKLN